MTDKKRKNLHALGAIVRILDGLTDDAARARAVDLAFSTPTQTEEIEAHAAGAIRRWAERSDGPEFVETCARAHLRATCGDQAATSEKECEDKGVTVERRTTPPGIGDC